MSDNADEPVTDPDSGHEHPVPLVVVLDGWDDDTDD
jgi:hypothetical protein